MRQGCPLSPTLFSAVLADLGRELETDEVGVIKMEKKKVKVLRYADDYQKIRRQ